MHVLRAGVSRELRPNPFGCQRNKGQVDVVVKGTKGFAGRGSPWQAGGEQSVDSAGGDCLDCLQLPARRLCLLPGTACSTPGTACHLPGTACPHKVLTNLLKHHTNTFGLNLRLMRPKAARRAGSTLREGKLKACSEAKPLNPKPKP